MAKPQAPRQMPFDLGHETAMSRDDLIVTNSNQGAIHFIESWPDWPAQTALLYGPPGSGKTHLGQVWCEMSCAENITVSEIEALLSTDAEVPGALLIEDIDSSGFEQTTLFHLLNAVRENDVSLLMTARTLPALWQVSLPDLSSRLKALPVTEISAPDDMLLAAVITKLFADRQIEIDQQVVSYLVRRMERSLIAANEIVQVIDRLALERKARITRQLANEALSLTEKG